MALEANLRALGRRTEIETTKRQTTELMKTTETAKKVQTRTGRKRMTIKEITAFNFRIRYLVLTAFVVIVAWAVHYDYVHRNDPKPLGAEFMKA